MIMMSYDNDNENIYSRYEVVLNMKIAVKINYLITERNIKIVLT